MLANDLYGLTMLFAIFARAHIALEGHLQVRRWRLVSLHIGMVLGRGGWMPHSISGSHKQ
jgi:hypothetical protein